MARLNQDAMLVNKLKNIRLLFFVTDCRGQGLVEYALLLVLIAIAVFAMVAVFGQQLGNTYEVINSSVQNAGK